MRKYKNAPIEEAMCEFSFAVPNPNAPWDLTLPGRVAQHPEITHIYNGPSQQQQVNHLFATTSGPAFQQGAPSMTFATGLLRVLIPTGDGKAILGVGANTLSISSLREYEGWDKFKPRIQTALKAYSETARQEKITRVVIKYINRIVAPSPGADTAAEYLLDVAPTHRAKREKEKKAFTARLAGYQYRKEYHVDDGVKIFVTQATLQPADPATSEFLLDLEVLWDAQTISLEEAMVKVEHLHATEGAIFESFITDKARKLFDEA